MQPKMDGYIFESKRLYRAFHEQFDDSLMAWGLFIDNQRIFTVSDVYNPFGDRSFNEIKEQLREELSKSIKYYSDTTPDERKQLSNIEFLDWSLPISAKVPDHLVTLDGVKDFNGGVVIYKRGD